MKGAIAKASLPATKKAIPTPIRLQLHIEVNTAILCSEILVIDCNAVLQWQSASASKGRHRCKPDVDSIGFEERGGSLLRLKLSTPQ